MFLAQAETAPQSLKATVEQAAERVPPEPKRRGRKPKPADEKTAERKRGKKKKTESTPDRKLQNRRRQKSSPAAGSVEAKPKRASRKKETQKRVPKKAAKPRTPKKDTRKRKTLSAEEAEKAALKSRQDSCYHVTRRRLIKTGMCDEDAKVEARKVTWLLIRATCLKKNAQSFLYVRSSPTSKAFNLIFPEAARLVT